MEILLKKVEALANSYNKPSESSNSQLWRVIAADYIIQTLFDWRSRKNSSTGSNKKKNNRSFDLLLFYSDLDVLWLNHSKVAQEKQNMLADIILNESDISLQQDEPLSAYCVFLNY